MIRALIAVFFISLVVGCALNIIDTAGDVRVSSSCSLESKVCL